MRPGDISTCFCIWIPRVMWSFEVSEGLENIKYQQTASDTGLFLSRMVINALIKLLISSPLIFAPCISTPRPVS